MEMDLEKTHQDNTITKLEMDLEKTHKDIAEESMNNTYYQYSSILNVARQRNRMVQLQYSTMTTVIEEQEEAITEHDLENDLEPDSNSGRVGDLNTKENEEIEHGMDLFKVIDTKTVVKINHIGNQETLSGNLSSNEAEGIVLGRLPIGDIGEAYWGLSSMFEKEDDANGNILKCLCACERLLPEQNVGYVPAVDAENCQTDKEQNNGTVGTRASVLNPLHEQESVTVLNNHSCEVSQIQMGTSNNIAPSQFHEQPKTFLATLIEHCAKVYITDDEMAGKTLSTVKKETADYYPVEDLNTLCAAKLNVKVKQIDKKPHVKKLEEGISKKGKK
ncbi:hypothetical protein DPMN_122377 [Dreissena polymorpha]|uniref:Uncharacterized protein n=1 Tax=Dreissena polymorpha TaxID=45954 RepID=A0A9D4GSF6_DREPO|nr:hypothetical protein DPMN_122377 [Dreissena polymorpha]